MKILFIYSQWLTQIISKMKGFVAAEASPLGILTESKKKLLLHHLILVARYHTERNTT